jgi:glycosyltransferase involved in cell wall biosynthesis
MRLAIVLYDGNIGGAEKVTAELAAALREGGVEATVVFVRDPGALAGDLDRLDVPHVSFGARRVEEVLLRARAFARLIDHHGPDGVLLPAIGMQAPGLRIGGYRAPIVAMEHGILLLAPHMPLRWRLPHALDRRISARFVDAVVAVSDFMLHAVQREGAAPRAVRIHNGVDVERYGGESASDDCVLGCATRMVPGKGVESLLRAFESLDGARLRIAGAGPERAWLAAMAPEGVDFAGVVDDMSAFWADVDVAVMPSELPESFGMAALEAMASGKPVVATRCGGVEELVEDGVTGRVVPVGDEKALAAALRAYASDPALRSEHGAAGRERCERHFSIETSARAYADLFADLGGTSVPRPVPAREKVNA